MFFCVLIKKQRERERDGVWDEEKGKCNDGGKRGGGREGQEGGVMFMSK